MIPDDSAFCDQCGKELKWCPECKRPKRGMECPVCGSDLVPGTKYLSGAKSEPAAPKTGPKVQDQAKAQEPKVQSTAAAVAGPTALVGNGWRLVLKEGSFGRNGGIWPELSSCPYVSGSHGRIEKDQNGWLLIDVGSTNGTFVNGNRIQKEFLRKGAKVRIATLDFIVE